MPNKKSTKAVKDEATDLEPSEKKETAGVVEAPDSKMKFPVFLYCRIANATYQFTGKRYPDGTWPPVKLIRTSAPHEIEITNEEDLHLMMGHALYGLEFWLVDTSVNKTTTKYLEGRQTAGSLKSEGQE
ncbi:MAG: hypothetical protein AB1690_02455 [Candidatus Zixiibacteriota bacterium]